MPAKLLHIDKEALFAHLSYRPHPGQLEVHLSAAPRRVLACGVRWGKSTLCVMETLCAALAPNDGGIGWIVGPSFDSVDLILVQVRRLLARRFAHRIIRIESRERTIVVRNLAGSIATIVGKSADNKTSLLGESVSWLVVDEAAQLKRDIWETALSQRLIDTAGWALLTSTPRGAAGWFHELFLRGQGTDPEFASWRAPTWDNPCIDRAIVEKERDRLPQAVFDEQYAGEFVGDGGIPCATCGWPVPFGGSPIVLVGDEELRTCVDCGRFVDEAGHAVADVDENGQPRAQVVVVQVPVDPPVVTPG